MDAQDGKKRPRRPRRPPVPRPEFDPASFVLPEPVVAAIRAEPELRGLAQVFADPPRATRVVAVVTKITREPYRKLRELLRELTGFELTDLIFRARLCRVATLLRADESSIKSIAMDEGYGTASTFTRTFHASVGLTPRAYQLFWFEEAFRRGLSNGNGSGVDSKGNSPG